MTEPPTFRDELLEAGILVPTASDGIYGRSSVYEDIVAGIERLVNATAVSEGTASYRFPPVMPRRVLEQSGYLSSFPDMIGSVSTFTGDNAEHKRLMEVAQSGGDWTSFLRAADVSLCPPSVIRSTRRSEEPCRKGEAVTTCRAGASGTNRVSTRLVCSPSGSTTSSMSARPTLPGRIGIVGCNSERRSSPHSV